MNNQPILPFVLIAGLLDSINPCAIAVLLIFIALMFTLRKSRKAMLGMGIAYIFAVFLTYFAIGLGIFKVFYLFETPHLIARIAAFFVLGIGVWGIKETFLPGKVRVLSIPISSRQLIAKWATKATIPAVLIAGFLVGLTEFPCSGAVYLATIGLLGKETTFLKGLIYLLLYNFMFVLPLIVIFSISTNRLIVEKIININEQNSKWLRLFAALIMLGMGVSMLIWFT